MKPVDPIGERKPRAPKHKICSACGQDRHMKQFRQVRDLTKANKGKNVFKRVDVCIPCEAAGEHQATLDEAKQRRKDEEEAARKARERKKAEKVAKARLEKMTEEEFEREVRRAEARILREKVRNSPRVRGMREEAKLRKKRALAEGPATELAQRELAGKSLLEYIRHFHGKYDAGWVHKLICKRLELFMRQVERQEDPRLMIFMPPRSGKSTIASQYFPSYVMGHHPDWEIIAASYAVSLPLGFSRKNRALVQEKRYHQVFPETVLDPNNQSAEGWFTTKEGMYLPAGVGGGITGKGAHILVIDDPIKDAEEAGSETVQEKIWEWWDSTAKTRLAPGGGVLIFHTRWSDRDLAGRLIKQMKDQHAESAELIEDTLRRLEQAEQEQDVKEVVELRAARDRFIEEREAIDDWEVLSFPALAKNDEYITAQGRIVTQLPEDGRAVLLRREGEALHPTRFSRARMMNRKKGMIPRWWNALYQQDPVPDEGEYFQKSHFRYVGDPTWLQNNYKRMKRFAAWDLAIGKKNRNDWTVGLIGGLDHDNRIYLLDHLRGRMGSKEIAKAILESAQRWQVDMIGLEEGQIKLAIFPYIQDVMAEMKYHPSFTEGKSKLQPITDKEQRARVGQGKLQNGQVYVPLPTVCPWVEEFINELVRFPAGLYDDRVDAFAWLMRMMSGQAPPPKPKQMQVKSWKDELRSIIAEGGGIDPMAA